MGADARGAAVSLARAAGDEDESVGEWAAAALEGLGPPAVDELRELVRLFSDTNGDAAYWAITLIGRLAEEGAGAVPNLMTALSDSQIPAVRQRAAWALGKIGQPAAAALPALQAAGASDDPRLARLAAEAIDAIRA
jgi:HEAT repeat protein